MEKRNRKQSGPLFWIIVIVLLAVIAFSLFNIIGLISKYQVGTDAYNKVAEQAGPAETGEKKAPKNLNWKKLRKINEDTVAWLRCKGTVIDYPVVQGEDNEFYLHHLITGEYDFKGCLFMDAANDGKFQDFNTIIYGHHMKDGSMFHCLTDYMEMDYYRKHKKMRLYTPEGVYDLLIFAAAQVPSDSMLYKVDFQSDEEKDEYLQRVEAESVIDTDVVPTVKDHLVMLSTCAYDFEDARMLVYGVMRPVS